MCSILFMEGVIQMTKEGRADYGEMTNEECREKLGETFEEVENNKILNYFCNLIPRLLKEWA